MSDQSPVLVIGNDLNRAAAKTSRHLCRALERLGRGAVCRDNRLVRWASSAVEKESPVRREAFETAVVAKWTKFVFDYGFDTIISLDLHWLFSSQLFLQTEKIGHIHSLWSGDLRSHLQCEPMFSLPSHTPLELINNPKVSHHCNGSGQVEEFRLLGLKRVVSSSLAAPEELLDASEPCSELKKFAFDGNPGVAPTENALDAMGRNENLAALRRLARQEILEGLPASWHRQFPQVLDLLATATEQRLAEPHTAAASLLARAGKAYPDAFDFLNRNGLILDAAMLIKSVNRYDRPGLVHRFWKRGWLDVFGAPEQWLAYGITGQPMVPFSDLASVYRRYPAQLNVANFAHEAAANEKLFEVAACARLSLNLDSPDIRACYSGDEIVLGESDEALEAAAEKILRDPSAALVSGEKARRRTAGEHLWEHRLKKVLA